MIIGDSLISRARDCAVGDVLAFLDASAISPAQALRALLDQSDDCVKILSPEGRLLFMNSGGIRVMEVDDFNELVGEPWENLWPEPARDHIRQALAAAQSGESARFSAACPTAAGTPKYWDVAVSPIPGADGRVSLILATSRDMTALRQRELAQETISREMTHRLRNAFALSKALLVTAARDAPEHKDFAAGVAGRLVALARAQGALVESDAAASELAPLVARCIDGMAGRATVEVAPMPDVVLAEGASRALALVLGELGTNSLKYGALRHGGAIRIEAELAADQQLALQWHETSVHDAVLGDSALPSGGEGIGLIQRIVGLYGGSVTTDIGPGGGLCTLRLPISA